MTVLAAQIALRADSFRRYPAFIDGEPALTTIAEHLGPLHEHGEVHHLERGGSVEAVLAWVHKEESWFGPPVTSVSIDYRLGADVAAWLREVFEDVLPRMDADFDLLLDASYADAYRVLRSLGLGVDSIILLGDVETASRRLRSEPFPDGVCFEPMVEDDIEDVLALFGETFTKEPQYCWFGGDPSYMVKKRERLEGLLALDHDELILRTERGIRGHISATVEPKNPLYGLSAGMSICLAPEQRERGLLRPIYRLLLDGMQRRGARTFKGGTSQRGVMHLGAEMGRTLRAVCFRRGAYFDEAHFEPWVPPTRGV